MYRRNKVVWSEGLLLSPQHFQQQDRYFEHLIKQHTIYHNVYFWGLIDFEIDTELLKMGKLALLSCHAIMNDGTYISMPEQADTPTPIDIAPGASNLKLYMSIAVRHLDSHHSDDDENLISHKTIKVNDNSQSSDNQTDIQIATPQIKLLTEHDHRTGYNCLAIAKIRECRATTGITLDEDFIPSCINIKASAKLQQLHQEIIAMLQHRNKILAKQITHTAQSMNVETQACRAAPDALRPS